MNAPMPPARTGTATDPTAPDIITFGCRLNAYESQVMAELARDGGVTNTVIVNTCAVTAEAERQARQAIRKARRQRPDAAIVVTGCAAQIDPARYAAMPEVTRVIGNREKLDPAHYDRSAFGGDAAEPVVVGDIMALTETAEHLIGGFEGRARAFVEVQQGCDHRCTFCIIPFGRGNNRSAPIGAIVDQVRTLVENGFNEVVLTGVDIASYGGDLPGRPTLGQMVRRLLRAVPELPRLRLSSLDPAAIDDDVFRALAEEERLMPHVHLSLQAGDDLILKRMKRRHSRTQAVAVADRLREVRPGIALGADLIAGFPTETEAMFENSLKLVEDCGLAFLHVFPYSEREGTPASRMPPVPKAERKARAARLRAAGAAALEVDLARKLDERCQVLIEDGTQGRTEHYAPITLDRPHAAGSIVRAMVIGAAADHLSGETA